MTEISEAAKAPKRRPIPEPQILAMRIKRSVVQTSSGCWEYPFNQDRKGYSHVCFKGKRYRAHRVMVLASGRSLPDQKVIDHLCRNPSCCNPDHLEVVTVRENTIRGNAGQHNVERGAKITHCIHGHKYTPENTVISKAGTRRCRECRREGVRQCRRKRRLGNG